jgi:hypothetical protein
MRMFWGFKFSFGVDILVFLATFFQKLGKNLLYFLVTLPLIDLQTFYQVRLPEGVCIKTTHFQQRQPIHLLNKLGGLPAPHLQSHKIMSSSRSQRSIYFKSVPTYLSGLHYKNFTIVIYNRNDSMIVWPVL